MRLIDAVALKKAITDATYNFEQIPIRVDKVQEIIDNAPTVLHDFNCSHCDYRKFSQSFIENVVKFMTDYNIETVEDLMKELNHINELLGGKQ